MDILSLKKEAKLSASDVPRVNVGNGEEDLQFSSLFTVFQRRFGFLKDEDEKGGEHKE